VAPRRKGTKALSCSRRRDAPHIRGEFSAIECGPGPSGEACMRRPITSPRGGCERGRTETIGAARAGRGVGPAEPKRRRISAGGSHIGRIERFSSLITRPSATAQGAPDGDSHRRRSDRCEASRPVPTPDLCAGLHRYNGRPSVCGHSPSWFPRPQGVRTAPQTRGAEGASGAANPVPAHVPQAIYLLQDPPPSPAELASARRVCLVKAS
jgi:hypothetical protein